MEEWQKAQIIGCLKYLTDNIEIKEMLTILRQGQFLREAEVARIKAISDPYEKKEEFLRVVQTRPCYDELLEGFVQTSQGHLKEKIVGQSSTSVQKSIVDTLSATMANSCEIQEPSNSTLEAVPNNQSCSEESVIWERTVVDAFYDERESQMIGRVTPTSIYVDGGFEKMDEIDFATLKSLIERHESTLQTIEITYFQDISLRLAANLDDQQLFHELSVSEANLRQLFPNNIPGVDCLNLSGNKWLNDKCLALCAMIFPNITKLSVDGTNLDFSSFQKKHNELLRQTWGQKVTHVSVIGGSGTHYQNNEEYMKSFLGALNPGVIASLHTLLNVKRFSIPLGKTLRKLTLFCHSVKDDDINALSCGCSQISHLNLFDLPNVTDKSLDYIGNFKSLKGLGLFFTAFSMPSLVNFLQHTISGCSLDTLCLSNVDDECVRAIASCHAGLRVLSIGNGDIIETSFHHLCRCMNNLKILCIRDMPFYPDCLTRKIVAESTHEPTSATKRPTANLPTLELLWVGTTTSVSGLINSLDEFIFERRRTIDSGTAQPDLWVRVLADQLEMHKLFGNTHKQGCAVCGGRTVQGTIKQEGLPCSDGCYYEKEDGLKFVQFWQQWHLLCKGMDKLWNTGLDLYVFYNTWRKPRYFTI